MAKKAEKEKTVKDFEREELDLRGTSAKAVDLEEVVTGLEGGPEVINRNFKKIKVAIESGDGGGGGGGNPYPVGSIYLSVSSVDPATIFGGTWTRFGKGKTLVGVDEADTDFASAEKTGGVKEREIKHQLNDNTLGIFNSGEEAAGFGLEQHTSFTDRVMLLDTKNKKYLSTVQPYITVFMWQRVA